MVNILAFPLFAETVSVSSTLWLNNLSALKYQIEQRNIKTLYIAPAKYIHLFEPQLEDLKNNITIEVHPFGGGFKNNSMILFSLNSEEDLKFFSKITEWTLSGRGDIISTS
jgi:hypothetical protein